MGFWRSRECGQTAVEYAVILALIISVALLSVGNLGKKINKTYQPLANALPGDGGSGGGSGGGSDYGIAQVTRVQPALGKPALSEKWQSYFMQDMGLVGTAENSDRPEELSDRPFQGLDSRWMWTGVALFLGFMIVASLAVHALERNYLRASALLAGGFMLASLIFSLVNNLQLTLAHMVVSLFIKGTVGFAVALLVGFPFRLYRSRNDP